MKKYLLAFILISIFFSCEEGEYVRNTHRVKQIINYQDDIEIGKKDFTYTGELLIETMSYDKNEAGEYVESKKTEIEYSMDKVTTVLYSRHEGDWLENEKNVYVIKNWKVSKHSNFSFIEGQWALNWKWVYEYSGSDLTGYHSYDDEMELEYKGVFIYEDNNFIEYQGFHMRDTNWVQVSIDSLTYSGDMYDVSNSYYYTEGEWIQTSKSEYIYSEDNVSEIYWYQQDPESGEWETVVFFRKYEYNEDGYLIEELNFSGKKEEIEYEEGHGNASLFVSAPIGVLFGTPYLKSSSDRKFRDIFDYILNKAK